MSAFESSSMLPAKPPVTVSEETVAQDESSETSNSEHSPSSDKEPVHSTNTYTLETTETLTVGEPPLPNEEPPPLANEEKQASGEDDGWEPVWDETAQAFYFYNKHTQKTQWENPRVSDAASANASRIADTGPPGAAAQPQSRKPAAGGYDPAIHGDYDPNADYAKAYEPQQQELYGEQSSLVDPAAAYAATGAFNRFTGKWQNADVNTEKFSDENKSKRQMNAFFNVDAAANSHDGKSLKAERSGKKISKADLKAYREKRKEKKEEKKRAWLRD